MVLSSSKGVRKRKGKYTTICSSASAHLAQLQQYCARQNAYNVQSCNLEMVGPFQDPENAHGQSLDGPNRENAHNNNTVVNLPDWASPGNWIGPEGHADL